MINYDPGLIAVLVGELTDLGVTLPDDVRRSAGQLLRLPSLRVRPAVPSDLLGLSDDQLRDVLRDLGIALALDGSGKPGEAASDQMGRALGEAVAIALVGIADDVLDQLRPRFAEAAAAVHAAAKLGISPRTSDRDILKADDVATWRDTWTGLPGHTRTLDSIAKARIGLTRTVGVPPIITRTGLWGNRSEIAEAIGAMFRDDAPPWREDFEETWQMWLRLSGGRPVELLTVEQSVAAAARSAAA